MFSILIRNNTRTRLIGVLKGFPNTTRIRNYYYAVGKDAVSLEGGDSVINIFIIGYKADKDPDSKNKAKEDKGIKA
ncbi:hypothetical protein K432DRAFT_410764 [Lepidopterella palustris CBS 459.81]|uniref:Uncharacterized protein n=1 Tax=Lepidopterella palustris CBS 459.81 TaxID=1314670 RepID=A0A8E2J8K5_9PEZI|nr:hypothetical protein K432DRAFT_410764 [Lepidopterella palustris CBS 459.81]